LKWEGPGGAGGRHRVIGVTKDPMGDSKGEEEGIAETKGRQVTGMDRGIMGCDRGMGDWGTTRGPLGGKRG
jgi:hypothetical protein